MFLTIEVVASLLSIVLVYGRNNIMDHKSSCAENLENFNRTEMSIVHKAVKAWRRILPEFIADEALNLRFKEPNHEFFNLLGPIGPSCANTLTSFGRRDEEKRVCGGLQLKSDTSKCVVFSVGSNNQYGFETDVVKGTKCFVEIFDCTVDTFSPPSSILSRVRTHKICLGRANEILDGLEFRTWDSLLQLTGLTTNPNFLKMDIEGYEYAVMQSILNSGKNIPLQIAMEIHHFKVFYVKGVRTVTDVSSAEMVTWFENLRTVGGYYLIDRNDNRHCSRCTEVVLAKLNCYSESPLQLNREELMFTTANHKLMQPAMKKFLNYTNG